MEKQGQAVLLSPFTSQTDAARQAQALPPLPQSPRVRAVLGELRRVDRLLGALKARDARHRDEAELACVGATETRGTDHSLSVFVGQQLSQGALQLSIAIRHDLPVPLSRLYARVDGERAPLCLTAEVPRHAGGGFETGTLELGTGTLSAVLVRRIGQQPARPVVVLEVPLDPAYPIYKCSPLLERLTRQRVGMLTMTPRAARDAAFLAVLGPHRDRWLAELAEAEGARAARERRAMCAQDSPKLAPPALPARTIAIDASPGALGAYTPLLVQRLECVKFSVELDARQAPATSQYTFHLCGPCTEKRTVRLADGEEEDIAAADELVKKAFQHLRLAASLRNLSPDAVTDAISAQAADTALLAADALMEECVSRGNVFAGDAALLAASSIDRV